MINPIIDDNSAQFYLADDNSHRTDGPAFITTSGHKSWYINGKRFCNNKSYQTVASLSDEDMLMITLKYGNVK